MDFNWSILYVLIVHLITGIFWNTAYQNDSHTGEKKKTEARKIFYIKNERHISLLSWDSICEEEIQEPFDTAHFQK